ncbi:IclR family transcriptional regulator [Xanthobacter dioxanivorans]|uniref:IclR family transcriptional regulator n=1 Tax=Xanthobacter dioxanivorans TaxID=2528964 RepID=A0A974SM60_9HYPH|nr:IclR family transcriptional regulator [Xanthobacter dioxanivorans]QRG09308.1 IclR family transcriptional regulator [Xanthobacter dioxanivorans]
MIRSEGPVATVPALVRGIAILRYLNAQPEPAGVIQIARDLNISQSTCFNLLRTLVQERLALFDPATKKYSPGIGVLELATSVLRRGSFVRLLHPHLARVALDHSVTVILWRLISPSRVLLIDIAEAPVPLRVYMTIGQRLPSLIGALGRCFAGHLGLPKEDIHAMFKELRWQDPPSFEQFWAEAGAARVDGYAVDISRYNRNFTTVAAPICGPDGLARSALSAIAFTNDLDAPRIRALAADLKAAAAEAAHSLDFGAADVPAADGQNVSGKSRRHLGRGLITP